MSQGYQRAVKNKREMKKRIYHKQNGMTVIACAAATGCIVWYFASVVTFTGGALFSTSSFYSLPVYLWKNKSCRPRVCTLKVKSKKRCSSSGFAFSLLLRVLSLAFFFLLFFSLLSFVLAAPLAFLFFFACLTVSYLANRWPIEITSPLHHTLQKKKKIWLPFVRLLRSCATVSTGTFFRHLYTSVHFCFQDLFLRLPLPSRRKRCFW